MTTTTKRRRRPNRSAESWKKTIKEWRASGLPAREFAERHDLTVSSLQNWSRRLRQEKTPTQAQLVTRHPRFVGVGVIEESLGSSGQNGASRSVEVEWPGGPVVRFRGDWGEAGLVSVLKGLARVTPC